MRAPEWIPEVAKAANCVYANLQPGTMPANLTYRLGADKRLAGVWRTLAEARHDKDVTVLFWMVVACAVGCCDGRLTVVTRRELEETAAQFRKTAQQLRLLVGWYSGNRKSGFFAKRPRRARGLRALRFLTGSPA